MTLDSSSYLSTANENNPGTMEIHTISNTSKGRFQKGILITESDVKSGSGIEGIPSAQTSPSPVCHSGLSCDSWCYLFIHNKKVQAFEEKVNAYNTIQEATNNLSEIHPYFIHKSVRRQVKPGVGICKDRVPTISGLIFMQGQPHALQSFLDRIFPACHLCKNCATGAIARIPDNQMRLFMDVMKTNPEQVMILRDQYAKFAKTHTLLRILSGPFKGQKGYIVRVVRDRKLIMDFGGLAVAIGGIHQEQFEPAE